MDRFNPINIKLFSRDLNNIKSWHTQYDLFVNLINDVTNTPVEQFKTRSFEQLYSDFFKVLHFCKSTETGMLKKACFKYVEETCQYLFYPKLMILSQVMSFFRKNQEFDLWFIHALRKAKKRSETLMGLALNIVDEHPILKKDLDPNLRKSIMCRIENYYFE